MLEMEPGEQWITYKLPGNEPIWGEFGWVTDLEFFEETDEPLEVVQEVWQLVSRETITVKPFGWDELQAELAEEEDDVVAPC